MRRIGIIMLVLASAALAGCTSLPQIGMSGGEGTTAARGVAIQEASYNDSIIPEGGATWLILRFKNTNPAPIEKLNADLSNLGLLTADLKRSSSGGEGCDFKGLRAASPDLSPPQKLCMWKLSAGKNAEGVYPVTLTLNHTTSLLMQKETPKFSFVRDPGKVQKKSRAYSNGEMALTVSFRSTHDMGAGTIEVDLTVRNAGKGSIGQIKGDRKVKLSYSGSLTDIFNAKTECKKIFIPEGERSETMTCKISKIKGKSPQAGTSYNLRIDMRYNYERRLELPLKVSAD